MIDSDLNKIPLIVYLAGPMRGYPEYNFPAFKEAAKNLRERGYMVFNPADHDLDQGFDPQIPMEEQDFFDLREAFAWDLAKVCTSEAIVVLPGWVDSRFGRLEVAVAEALDIPIYAYPTLEPIRGEPVAIEAARLVAGPRQGSYGHPADDFTRTGQMWGAILGTEAIPPHLVGLCQVALKISREVENHKRDNLVDIAGYAETVNLVEQRLPRS